MVGTNNCGNLFSFWCQKVLPTVYDDSLSDYELLCKVVNYLSDLIKTVDEHSGMFDNIYKEFKELKDYVDNYFDELDVNEAIENKINNMVEDGTLGVVFRDVLGYVTPQMYGAKGDGVTDDTQAIKNAIGDNVTIFFPAGRYVVSSTINIDKYIHIYGEGPYSSCIVYNGTGYLFNVTTSYANKPLIEQIYFDGADNGFMKCSRGDRWGSSVMLKNFRVNSFSGEAIRFESCYNVVIEDGVISTNGKIVFTTFDGTITGDNFCNNNVFTNVYVRAFTSNRNETLIDLFNTRLLTFNSCAVERATTLIKGVDCSNIVFNQCWFENCEYLYDFDSSSASPYLNNCQLALVDNLNTNVNGLEYANGYQVMYNKSGSNASIIDTQGIDIGLLQQVILNDNDGYSNWFNIYRISTKSAVFNVPLNNVKSEGIDTNRVTISLSNILRFSSIEATFNANIYVRYADASYRCYEARILRFGTNYILCKNDLLTEAAWEGSDAYNATETIALDGGTLSVNSTSNMTRCVIVCEYNIHPVS